MAEKPKKYLKKMVGCNYLNEILDNNPQSVDDFKNGKDRAGGFLVGQIMKATKGQANPGVVNKLLKDELAKR